jgi:hypothetical protein
MTHFEKLLRNVKKEQVYVGVKFKCFRENSKQFRSKKGTAVFETTWKKLGDQPWRWLEFQVYEDLQ